MCPPTKKERVLLKISGAGLRGTNEKNVVDGGVLSHLAGQIREIADTHEVAIVVGGGNIWRGGSNMSEPLRNRDTHVLGMLATVMNGVVLQNYLAHIGVKSIVFSALSMPEVAETISTRSVRAAFERGEVVIFAGGTGLPYVTTDTCVAVRAIEIGADKILIGKNGVKGVYDRDPNKYSDAKFYDRVSYEEIIDKRLEVMDLTAMSLLLSFNKPKLIVFNNDEENSFVRALKGDILNTVVY